MKELLAMLPRQPPLRLLPLLLRLMMLLLLLLQQRKVSKHSP